MKKFDLKDSDQFFHCYGFCKVSKSSAVDKASALKWGERKEMRDKFLNFFGLYGKVRVSSAAMDKDSEADLKVNEWGFKCPKSQSCEKRCEKLINPAHLKTKQFLRKKGHL